MTFFIKINHLSAQPNEKFTSPSYFPSISHYANRTSNTILFEIEDNFKKQTQEPHLHL
jgi:hypothetical protein